MANIMSKLKLSNRPTRDGFDLSRKIAFTAKVGELLPVACVEVLPDDVFDGRKQHFTRTPPVSTAAYTRIREYYDWFFVPTNLLWNRFNTFVTQMRDNSQHATGIISNTLMPDKHPWFSTQQVHQYLNAMYTAGHKNMFMLNRAKLSAKLLSYLGYGDFSSIDVNATSYRQNATLNPFPLLAYQKIYADYFRNSQWESSYAPSWNVDYLNGGSVNSLQIPIAQLSANANYIENMFDMRYSNWSKDLFTGLQPNSQYGEASMIGNTSTVDVSLNFASPTDFESELRVKSRSGETLTNGESVLIGTPSTTFGSNILKTSNSQLNQFLSAQQVASLRTALGLSTLNTSGSLDTSFSILALRQAEALQKWKEITQSQQQDYKNQIEAHWGVSMSDAYSERCKYIDGHVNNLDISEVLNTNITGENAADIAGKGVGVGDGSFKFKAPCHGYLMCIYHAVPLLDYSSSGIDRMCLKSTSIDYAIPEFDRTGMVSVPLVELSNNQDVIANSELLGYAPRYYDYKQARDQVKGGFKDFYSHWVAPVSDEYIMNYLNSLQNYGEIDYKWFKVNPAVLNPIFVKAVDDTYESDQLLVNCHFDLKAVRSLDRNGLPY